MGTLGTLKSRIALELRRSDLTDDIANAIQSAIDFYSNEFFYFNQAARLTFNTVAGRDTYTSADLADLGNVLKVTLAHIIIGPSPYKLNFRPISLIENVNLWNRYTAQPVDYCWYGQKFYLSPIPSAVWTVKINAYLIAASPSSDTDDSTPWTNDAELLIRCRAKSELYAHVIKKADQAQIYAVLAAEALQQLRDKTAALIGNPVGAVEASPFW